MPPNREPIDLCAFDELVEGEIVELRAGGVPVAVGRWEGRVYAFNPTCPHKGAPLVCGKLMARLGSGGPGQMDVRSEAPIVSCPWHGWEFALDNGENVADRSEKGLRLQRCDVVGGRVKLGIKLGPAAAGE
ncbi:MAG: Rieske 2Fe-2S domain-containing protein [Actinobacteria bacterium]|nr:Rieske 2Fe-2S domain-containing protein [Actinomycetota bacterium]